MSPQTHWCLHLYIDSIYLEEICCRSFILIKEMKHSDSQCLSTANPQRPQGLGVCSGLRPGPAHAAERLPGRHAEGVERRQLHPHRRGQRSRQPH